MANSSHPGTSRRCEECRRRRKKCDLGEPECGRCISRGVKCSGPNNLPLYVIRDAHNINTQSHRSALRLAMQRRAAPNAWDVTRQTDTTSRNGLGFCLDVLQQLTREVEVSVLRTNAPLCSKPTEFFYSTVLDAFQPRDLSGVFSGDRLPIPPVERYYSSMAMCIRGLLPFAKCPEQHMLDQALFSLLTLYLGRLVKDVNMTELARSAYVSAIREFRLAIGSSFSADQADGRSRFSPFFLAVSTALQLFEFVNDMGKTGPAFLTHYEGMLQFLKLMGPEVHQSPARLQSYSGLRGISVCIALEQRQENFLSQPQWIHAPFLSRPKTRMEELHDIALGIPAILTRTDDLLASLGHEAGGRLMHSPAAGECHLLAQLTIAEMLMVDFKRATSELEQWLQQYKNSLSPTPIYWKTNEVFDNAYAVVDTHCVPIYSNADQLLRFRDGQKAGSMVAYWGIMLEVLMSMIDVQDAVSKIPTSTPEGTARALALAQDLDNNRASASETVSLILQSMPYLECCLEGIFAMQLPLRVVRRYLARSQAHDDDPCLIAE